MSDARAYRYNGRKHRPSEMAQRLCSIGVEKLKAEGMPAEAAELAMRAIVTDWCDEFGGTLIHIPRMLAWDGLTARDREIWAAYNGSNIPELVQRFRLCERQVRYVIDYCRRWHTTHHQPELPGLAEATQPQEGEPA